FSIICIFVFPQDDPEYYTFSSLTREEGLGHNQVECIFQDSDGFMWFGTRNGLTRYDGYELKTYRPSADANSISGNWVLCINEDTAKNLWIGTLLHGVNKLDMETGEFTRFGDYYGFGKRVNKVTVLNDGSVYLCTEYGLAQFRPDSNDFKVYLPDNGNPHSINSTQVFDMLQTRKGDCYVATWNQDIQRFDPENGSFMNVSYKRSGDLNVDYRKRIIEDNDGNLWISASRHGLARLNPKTGESKLYTHKQGELNTNILNGDMMVDAQGNIWVATDGQGIDIYHPEEERFTYLTADDKSSSNLPGNQVYTLFMDNQNNIWAGFYDKGVAFYDPANSKFSGTLFHPDDLWIFKGTSVISLFQDSKKRVWVGTDGDGLFMFEKGKKKRIFRHVPINPNSISSNVITSIAEDASGHILAGTYSGGLNSIDLSTGRIKHYQQKDNSKYSVHSASVWEIYRDSRNRIWLGLLGNGIDLFDPVKGTFINFGPSSTELNKVDHPNTMVITEDSDGDVWFGTEGKGVYILDSQTHRITRMQSNTSDSLLWYSVIRSFYQDRKGEMWIGTEGEGAFIYNKKNANIRQLTTRNGLPDMIVQGIQEDSNGNIWLATGFGLCMYAPSSNRFVHFSASDGLSGNEFNADALMQLDDGRLLAGSTNGLDVFDPSGIVLNQNIPRVMITQIKILNVEVHPGDTINNRVLLQKQISYTDEIALNYRDKIFSLEFAALNYTHPEKCKYQYKLSGFDENWVKTDASMRVATYSNLKKGDYVFRVKASNNDGKWGNNTRELLIHVLPPFWDTWWFYSLLLVTCFFII
ncbi:MAG TPA: two-component regulator propeller domain-containing protein, partial [Bacteroidales bacterium]|nr:two-component regulator propeller domain-containing protein [Bacteroidales bacterium]